jgi:colanic acid biosynthesis glycosyl transferase WcaI
MKALNHDQWTAESAAVDGAIGSIAADCAERQTSKILVYSVNYFPEMAGAGRYTGEIAEELAARGVEVLVVTTPPHYPGWRVHDGYKNNRYAWETRNGVKVRRCPLILRERMGGIWRLLAPLTFALTSAPIAIWEMLRQRPDAILCIEPTLFVAPISLLMAKAISAQTVLHVQDLEVDAAFAVGHLAQYGWLRRIGEIFERRILRRFDRIVTISEAMAERLVQKGVDRKRLAIIRNWVDLDMIHPLKRPSAYRSMFNLSADDFVVMYSGNLGAKQGLNVLLDAARLLTKFDRIKIVIAGEGPAKAELIDKYGDLPQARFLPFQPYDLLNEFLNLADVHVLPQDRRAADLVLPSKLGGMLASGKPIIVTAEVGTELAAFLGDAATMTPSGDSEALADAIRRHFEGHAIGRAVEKRLALSRLLSKQDGLGAFCRLVRGGPAEHGHGADKTTPAVAARADLAAQGDAFGERRRNKTSAA